MKWIDVTPEEARKHPFHGVGGWLFVTAVMIIATIGFNAVGTFGEPTPDLSRAPESLAWLIRAEYAAAAVMVIWGVLALALMFGMRKAFRPVFIAFMIALPLVSFADIVAAYEIGRQFNPGLTWEDLIDKDVIRATVGGSVRALIWVSYAIVSRRVNVTFYNRVLRDDLKLVRPEGGAAPASPVLS